MKYADQKSVPGKFQDFIPRKTDQPRRFELDVKWSEKAQCETQIRCRTTLCEQRNGGASSKLSDPIAQRPCFFNYLHRQFPALGSTGVAACANEPKVVRQ
jgi:hypothetical protein